MPAAAASPGHPELVGWASGQTPPQVHEEPWVTNREWVVEDINPSLPPWGGSGRGFPMEAGKLQYILLTNPGPVISLGFLQGCCTSPALGLARDLFWIQGLVLLP